MRVLSPLVVTIALLGLPAAAPGQGPADDVARAKAQVAAATELARSGDWVGGLRLFREAQPYAEALGDPAGLQWNIARCLEELGRNEEAIQAFEAYLELPDSTDGHVEAGSRIEALVRVTYGFLDVQCGGATAIVRIRDRAGEQACPHRFRLRPGRYRLEAKARDGRRAAATAVVRVGETTPAALTLPAPNPALGGAPGGAADEVRAGTAPEAASPLVPWLVAGGAVALAGAGTGFLVSASGSFGDAEAAARRYNSATSVRELASARGDVESDLDTGRLHRSVGYGLLGAGALAAGAATWLFLSDGPSDDELVDGAALTVTPQRSGVALIWSGGW